MRISQWQWLRSSFESPRFSEPKRRATRPAARRFRISRPPSRRSRTACCGSRRLSAVVPTTSEQSATASANDLNSSARASRGAAATAERASRNASSYGFTTRRCRNPKLLIARAAAPRFSGFRGATITTRRFSDWIRTDKILKLTTERQTRTPNLVRSSRAQRGIWGSMLIERLRLNPDVLFARSFFGVELLHPRLETLARRRVFPGERQTGNFGVSNLDSISPALRHHLHVAFRQRGAVRTPVEHIAFHPLPIFQGDGQVSTIVKRLLQRFPNLRLARQGRHPSFEILVRKTESLIPRFWCSWHR